METKQPTKKQKRDENINKILILSKELDVLINQSVIEPDAKNKLLLKSKELKELCYAQSSVIRLGYMIYFYKNLNSDKKAQYTKGFISSLNKIVNKDAVNED